MVRQYIVRGSVKSPIGRSINNTVVSYRVIIIQTERLVKLVVDKQKIDAYISVNKCIRYGHSTNSIRNSSVYISNLLCHY